MMDRLVILQDTELLRFIPQSAPFVMVDALYEISEKQVQSGLTIKEDNVLCKNDHFQESGLIETMAQTCALSAGYMAHQQGKTAPVGYIAGLKNIDFYRLPKVGEKIKTEVKLTEMMNMQIAKARVFDKNNETLAEGELRIFIKPDEHAS